MTQQFLCLMLVQLFLTIISSFSLPETVVYWEQTRLIFLGPLLWVKCGGRDPALLEMYINSSQ